MEPLSRSVAAILRLALPPLLALLCAFPSLSRGAASPPLSMEVRPENRRILLPGHGEDSLLIEIAAPDLPARDDRRRGLNLAVVVDRSGSMAEQRKLDFVKAAVHQLADRLGPGDVLSLVSYDDRVEVPFPASTVDGRRDEIHRAVERLYPGGRTFLSGGLEEGFRQARAGRRRGFVNRVLLLSDGLANVGVSDAASIGRRSSAMAEEGVSVSTFGVGNDFDEELLLAAATCGGGQYHYLSDPERIASSLDAELRRSARLAAAEVEIRIRIRPGCRFRSVVGREHRRVGEEFAVRLGDLSAGDRRSVLAAIEVAGSRPGSVEVATVSYRYRDPASGEVVSSPPRPVSLEAVRDEAKWRAGIDGAVRERRAVAESSAIVREAARAADGGRKEEAKRLLGQAASALSAAPPSPAVREELERATEYGRTLDSMGDMSSGAAKGAQKAVKYRTYERLEKN
jgi:Ca-activated chloride channel family protein